MIQQFQWHRNGRPIFGQTSQFYTLKRADLDADIICVIRIKRRVPSRHKSRIKRWKKCIRLDRHLTTWSMLETGKIPTYSMADVTQILKNKSNEKSNPRTNVPLNNELC